MPAKNISQGKPDKYKNFAIIGITLDPGPQVGLSILIRNDNPHNKINLKTNLQGITAKATRHRTLNVYSLYNLP